MSATTIIYVIIQIAAGAIGGNIFAKITQFTLGPLYNSIVGAVVGGVVGAVWGTPFWGPPNSPRACWIDNYFHRHCRYYGQRHYY